MADWHVIENTGLTLVSLIERRISELAVPGVTVGLVTTAAFPGLAATNVPFISLLLYQIQGNPELRNLRQAVRPDGSLRRQSLPLELCYLITAWGVRTPLNDGLATREEARLMGVVLQAFYDNAEVGRSALFETPGNPVWAPFDALQIVMETLPVDVHYRIWDAAELGYRLSVPYRVRVASLEPALLPVGPPVTEANLPVAS